MAAHDIPVSYDTSFATSSQIIYRTKFCTASLGMRICFPQSTWLIWPLCTMLYAVFLPTPMTALNCLTVRKQGRDSKFV